MRFLSRDIASEHEDGTRSDPNNRPQRQHQGPADRAEQFSPGPSVTALVAFPGRYRLTSGT
jgi:hypothetical protein